MFLNGRLGTFQPLLVPLITCRNRTGMIYNAIEIPIELNISNLKQNRTVMIQQESMEVWK